MARKAGTSVARAARRQSEVARLKEVIVGLHATIDTTRDAYRKEVDELRIAARQLHAGLLEYAKESNWEIGEGFAIEHPRYTWKGEGDGPKVARKFLGLEEDTN